MPFIPLHQFSVNGDYRLTLGHDSFRALTLGVNVAGQGKTYWEANNLMSQKFYATLGAHIALDMGAVELNVWGRNLTNTYYNTFLVYSKLTNQNFAQRGNPIQVGFDLNIHF